MSAANIMAEYMLRNYFKQCFLSKNVWTLLGHIYQYLVNPTQYFSMVEASRYYNYEASEDERKQLVEILACALGGGAKK